MADLQPVESSPPTSALWRTPDFSRLWAGQAVSELCSRITRDGLPILAVLTLGAKPAQMGLLEAAGSAPVILIGLFAGVWVDRLRRRQVMVWADIFRAGLLLTIPVAAAFRWLSFGQLYLVAALTGIAAVFFDVAYQAYLPSLVSRENVLEGNRLLTLSSSFAELAGPGLAGFLIQVFTAPAAILLDALSFLVSVFSLLLIKKQEPVPQRMVESSRVLDDLAEGIRAVWFHPVLRAVALSTATRSFFGSFIGVLYAIFALQWLGLGPALLGITIAFGGASDILGSLFSTRIVHRFGLGRTLIGAQLLASLATFFIPLAGGPILLGAGSLMAAQLLGDGLGVIFSINELSLRQSIVPDRLLGRVNAGIHLMSDGIGPIGAIIGGLLAEWLGVRQTLLLASAGLVLSAAWLMLSPIRGMVSLPKSTEENLGQG